MYHTDALTGYLTRAAYVQGRCANHYTIRPFYHIFTNLDAGVEYIFLKFASFPERPLLLTVLQQRRCHFCDEGLFVSLLYPGALH